nr:hypothetical protein CFP56_25932 [Quercus suber]
MAARAAKVGARCREADELERVAADGSGAARRLGWMRSGVEGVRFWCKTERSKVMIDHSNNVIDCHSTSPLPSSFVLRHDY